MNLEKMSKPELMEQFARLFGATPAGLSKAELIEGIEAKTKTDAKEMKESKEVFPDNLTKTASAAAITKTNDPVPAVVEGEIEVVKFDDLGNVIDRMTIHKDAWNLLPDHHYGWKKAAPKEIQ